MKAQINFNNIIFKQEVNNDCEKMYGKDQT